MVGKNRIYDMECTVLQGKTRLGCIYTINGIDRKARKYIGLKKIFQNLKNNKNGT